MKKCKFDTTKKCGHTTNYCPQCPIRKTLKQKLLTKEPPTTTIETTQDTETKKLTCPYCLYTDYLTRFKIKTKKGYSETRFKCPDCGEIMRKETLTKPMTIQEYAQWVYDTKAWKRISWNKWKQRLQQYGLTQQFWEAYKKHKTEMQGETYEDYLMRKQQEMYESGELIQEME